jgi:hypothetical protein
MRRAHNVPATIDSGFMAVIPKVKVAGVAAP